MLWSTVKLLLSLVTSIIFGPLKTLPRSSKSCDCVTFRVFQYLLSTFLLYTPHWHMILSKQVLSLVNWCFNRESKTYLCTSVKAGFFSNKKYDSYRCWSCAELCEAFTFLIENIRGLFKMFCYERLFIRKNNVCLTDFVHKYSSFYHTCTCEISKESSKYQNSYWHLKWPIFEDEKAESRC